MNALYELQCDLQKQIANAFANFKKKGANKMTLSAAQARLSGLEECFSQFKANHKKFLTSEVIPRDHEYFNQGLFDLVADSYYDRKGEFLQFFADANQREREQNPPALPVVQATPAPRVDHHTLPKMELPKFSGNFSEWENFRDLFRSVVHRRADLDASLKFYYLRSNLTGEAMERIKSIPIAGDQYERAWKALTDYYENKRRIVGTHVSNILAVKPMKTESSAELKRVALTLIVHWAVEPFENETKKDWKKSLDQNDNPPTINQLKTFIASQIETLESIEGKRSKSSSNSPCQKPKQSRRDIELSPAATHAHQTTSKASNKKSTRCSLCSQEHPLRLCEQFLRKPAQERREFVQTKRLCFNCLTSGHSKNQCKSRFTCFTCKAKHNTLLHIDNVGQLPDSSTGSSTHEPHPPAENATIVTTSCANVSTENETQTVSLAAQTNENVVGVLLATARVCAVGPKGKKTIARALIDPCSQVSLVTQGLRNRLGLNCKQTHVCIQGVGATASATARKMAHLTIRPHFESSTVLEIEALVLQKLSSYKPPASSGLGSLEHLKTLQLADPLFANPARVELLLGADVFADIVLDRVIRGSKSEPVALQSKLGWLLTGHATSGVRQPSIPTSLHCSCDKSQDSQLSDLLYEFWRAEEIGVKNSCSDEDKICEALFASTTYRNDEGRYVVRLPWRNPEATANLQIGTSYTHALRALQRLEDRFKKDKMLKEEYSKFIREYIRLGHMSLVPVERPSRDSDYYFLPHHGVWKESSSTTKLRTVFNGSNKLASGESLNDLLYSGKNLLPNPVDLIVSWRNYLIALSADMEKIYRQTEVHESDKKFQAIIWRFDPRDEIQVYVLNTLTYGLTCAQFFAIRALLQLAIDHEAEHPLAAQVVREEMYSDNALTGGHSLPEARSKIKELIELFEKGRFNLRKWSSSDPRAISLLPEDKLICDKVTLFTPETSVPILGVPWHPKCDYFQFQLEDFPMAQPFTKGSVLSRIARIFDPLGWLAPVIVQAKILMQSLWLLKIGWDDELLDDISNNWARWLEELPLVRGIKITRWTAFTPEAKCVEIHGFADASTHAFGAVIYLGIVRESTVQITLQVAKTRVALIKTLTIPRLELCAAVLLTRLVEQVTRSLKFEVSGLHLCTDSADVLFWLRDRPPRWGVFIANRCSEIHTTLPTAYWHHVRSKENPADVISRGIDPSRLESHTLWWNGPEFLSDSSGAWPRTQDELNFVVHSVTRSPGYSGSVVSPFHVTPSSIPLPLWELVDRYATLSKLLRITAYCLRFIKRITIKMAKSKSALRLSKLLSQQTAEDLPSAQATTAKIDSARLMWCLLIQRAYFASEFQQLARKGTVPSGSSIVNLNPFIQNELIKVGGRLRHALIDEDAMHPVILPHSCSFTKLVIRHIHALTLHGGTQLTLGTVKRQYWIVRGRLEVKSVIRQCVPCIRFAARSPNQLMEVLPSARVCPSPPFAKSGVDYDGPIRVRLTNTRGRGTLKGYVCIFICMATRAVRLELVEDYTSEAFLGSLFQADCHPLFTSPIHSYFG